MTEPPDQAVELPLDGIAITELIVECTDLSFFLSTEKIILEVYVADNIVLPFDPQEHWVGSKFNTIIASDSQNKAKQLIRTNAGLNPNTYLWRHINFVSKDGHQIPLLTKQFIFDSSGEDLYQIVCRDLRPLTDLNARWLKETKDLMALRDRNMLSDGASLPSSSADKLVGVAPLGDIVQSAVSEIIGMCLESANKATDGDDFAAARLLGISVAEYKDRMRQHLSR